MPAGALEHHAAALTAAATIDDPAVLALALEGHAAGLVDPTDRAVLLGAADRLWSENANVERTHRDDVAAIADAARRALGADAFAAAFAEGASSDRRVVLARARRAS